jgi:hypothetical protein
LSKRAIAPLDSLIAALYQVHLPHLAHEILWGD